MLGRIATMASGLALAACSVVGIRETEEPAYTVVAQVGPAEIRQYGPRLAAETVVAGGEGSARAEGFRRVAGYIFGGNTARAKIAMTAPVAQSPGPAAASSETIAMTAPVVQSRTGDGWTIQFFMPANWTQETLPVPTDPSVRIVAVPAQTMAVLRFTGEYSPGTLAARRQQLLDVLNTSNWVAQGTPVAWFYDPPWTLPFLRKNEIAVTVTSRSAG